MKEVIEIQGVTKRFGTVSAVDDISLSLHENEFFALLGPSGSGKTTLLRLIAGLELPDVGRILLDGKDMTPIRPNRRPVNIMFQSYALFPHLSVYDNVAYGLKMEKLPRDEISRRVAEALEMVQLAKFAGRRPQSLSGGEQQRVALARALIKRPRILLLDEPLAALDRKLRDRMQIELQRLQHEVGITFLVVTHDQEEALGMADRIAVMDHGRSVQLGTPQELYEYPRNRFVADFIGVMNFFQGVVAAGGIEVPGIGLLCGDANRLELGSQALLAVRPEKVRVDVASPADNMQNCIAGTIVGTAYFGQDLNVHIRIAEQKTVLIARVNTSNEVIPELRVGTLVWCSWPPECSRILTD